MTRPFPSLLRVLLAVPLLACGGCRDQFRVLALVLAVKGDVTVGEAAGGRLSPGAEIAAPSTIRTAADGTLVISPLPGVMIRLESGGALGIERIELHKRGDEVHSRAVLLRLREGRARLWVDQFQHATIDLRMQTPAGDVIARGPVLAEVAVQADGSVRVICVSGSLFVAGTTLSSGQWAELSAGQNAPVTQVAADSDAIWKSLLEVRDLEPQLLDLQARQRDRTPVRTEGPPEKAPKN